MLRPSIGKFATMHYLILALHYLSYVAWYAGVVLLCLGVIPPAFVAWGYVYTVYLRREEMDPTGGAATGFVVLIGVGLLVLGGIAMVLSWAFSAIAADLQSWWPA
jgi:hypothetical protein